MGKRSEHAGGAQATALREKLKIGICQVFTGPIDDLEAPAPATDRLQTHLQNLYDTAVEEEVDFLTFPQYKTALINKIQPQEMENLSPSLIMSGSHLRKLDHFAEYFYSGNPVKENGEYYFGLNMGLMHITPAERYASAGKGDNCKILYTDHGNFGISAGVDFLYEDFSTQDIIGLFILTNRAGVSSFINGIHRLLAVNNNIKFIAFTNGSTNVPYRFLYTKEQVYALNMGERFREYYQSDPQNRSHYVLKERDNQRRAYKYLEKYMYTSGCSGLFCREYNLENFETPNDGCHDDDDNFLDCKFNGKTDFRIRKYSRSAALHAPGENVAQLTCTNKLSTDYLMIFEYEFKTQRISFADVIESPALKT